VGGEGGVGSGRGQGEKGRTIVDYSADNDNNDGTVLTVCVANVRNWRNKQLVRCGKRKPLLSVK